MVSQGIPGRLRTSAGWLGSKQRDKAKGSRKEFISGCALAKSQEKSLPTSSRCQNHPRQKSSIPDLGYCRAWGWGHCYCILFLTYLQVPGKFQCISGPLESCLMLGWAHICSVKAGPGCGGEPQASGGTGSRQGTRARGRGGQRFQSQALRRKLQHKAHSETRSRSLNHSC